MNRSSSYVGLVAKLLLGTLIAVPAVAHHRQTPPVSRISDDGSTPAPRLTNLATNFGVTLGNGSGQVATIVHPDRLTNSYVQTPIGTSNDDRNASIAKSRRAVVWDAPAPGLPGRQVFRWTSPGTVAQLTSHPTGTCENPGLDAVGRTVVFECTADVAGTGTTAVRRIIRWGGGVLSQISTGQGDSRNASTSISGGLITYESTDDPTDGHDTGIAQIWIKNTRTGTIRRITNGAGPSRHPALTDNGRLVAFQSTADLAGDNHETGINRIYVYDTKEDTYARLTDDPGGCTNPSVMRNGVEYHAGFVCTGQARRYGVHNDEYLHLATPDGLTTSLVLTFSRHYVLLSTNSDLLSPGQSTPGSQLYLWNVFKEAGTPLPAAPLWFPFRSIN